MKKTIGLAFALAFALAAPAVSETADTSQQHHKHHHKHHTAQQAKKERAPAAEPQALEPAAGIRPYAHPGEGDDDGLSRNPDDCNKGCIDGNPG